MNVDRRVADIDTVTDETDGPYAASIFNLFVLHVFTTAMLLSIVIIGVLAFKKHISWLSYRHAAPRRNHSAPKLPTFF